MILITLVFLGISWYEWRFLKHRGRKTRTYWITGCCLVLAYLYVSAVYLFKNLPSPNHFIEFVVGM